MDIDTSPDDLAAAANRRQVREFAAALQALAADPRFADLHVEITDPLAAAAPREQRAALVAAHQAVARFQERRLRGGHGLLDERTATQILLDAAAPEVQYYEFKIAEEARVGADWLWVWLDPAGGCFMVLVQAKSAKAESRRFAVDLGYRSGKHKVLQMDLLLESSRVFGVPFAYVFAVDPVAVDLPGGALFPQLPRDRGHFPVPYLPHVLGGLRAEVPGYVADALAGRTPPDWVTERLAGIVVVPPSGAAAGQQVAPQAPALPNRPWSPRQAA
ncbi:hypothetical protein [Kitasatospora purpeofusca]|uniref:hypothetical protein n=1 Tax=Kitasatospora purpeofusca TaxID=67352 RepID=UPI00369F471B